MIPNKYSTYIFLDSRGYPIAPSAPSWWFYTDVGSLTCGVPLLLGTHRVSSQRDDWRVIQSLAKGAFGACIRIVMGSWAGRGKTPPHREMGTAPASCPPLSVSLWRREWHCSLELLQHFFFSEPTACVFSMMMTWWVRLQDNVQFIPATTQYHICRDYTPSISNYSH